MNETAESDPVGEVEARRTEMPDGRYLIYFEFPDTAPLVSNATDEPNDKEARDV